MGDQKFNKKHIMFKNDNNFYWLILIDTANLKPKNK